MWYSAAATCLLNSEFNASSVSTTNNNGKKSENSNRCHFNGSALGCVVYLLNSPHFHTFIKQKFLNCSNCSNWMEIIQSGKSWEVGSFSIVLMCHQISLV